MHLTKSLDYVSVEIFQKERRNQSHVELNTWTMDITPNMTSDKTTDMSSDMTSDQFNRNIFDYSNIRVLGDEYSIFKNKYLFPLYAYIIIRSN